MNLNYVFDVGFIHNLGCDFTNMLHSNCSAVVKGTISNLQSHCTQATDLINQLPLGQCPSNIHEKCIEIISSMPDTMSELARSCAECVNAENVRIAAETVDKIVPNVKYWVVAGTAAVGIGYGLYRCAKVLKLNFS